MNKIINLDDYKTTKNSDFKKIELTKEKRLDSMQRIAYDDDEYIMHMLEDDLKEN